MSNAINSSSDRFLSNRHGYTCFRGVVDSCTVYWVQHSGATEGAFQDNCTLPWEKLHAEFAHEGLDGPIYIRVRPRVFGYRHITLLLQLVLTSHAGLLLTCMTMFSVASPSEHQMFVFSMMLSL